MFELLITETGRSFAKGERYRIFNEERKNGFSTMREVYKYLRERYGKSKCVPMYVDWKNGTTIKCGWVIAFRNADFSHAPIHHWLQQDWIEVRKSEAVSL